MRATTSVNLAAAARRDARRLAAPLTALWIGLAFLHPSGASAQNVKDLMGKAQTQSDQRAVEELVRRLHGSTTAASPQPPAVSPAEAPRTERSTVPPQETAIAPQPPRAPKPRPTEPPSTAPQPSAPETAAPETLTEPSFATVRPAPRPPAPPPVEIARHDRQPSVDIEIYFAYKSDRIAREAASTLTILGRALTDPSLDGARFLIAGHTDAKGSAAYNRELSERRAASVRQFLIERFGIAPDRLVSRGYGFERLRVPSDPMAVANRRVQIVNLSASPAR